MNFEEKKKKLNIPEENVYLLQVPVEEIDVAIGDYESKLERINSFDIVGSTRNGWEGKTWGDVLDHCFHKMYWFDNRRIQNINSILLHPLNEDFPVVVEENNKFYIDGDGLHRLVIVKLLGIDNVPVIVKRRKVLINI